MGATTVEANSSHVVMLSQPDLVVDVIRNGEPSLLIYQAMEGSILDAYLQAEVIGLFRRAREMSRSRNARSVAGGRAPKGDAARTKIGEPRHVSAVRSDRQACKVRLMPDLARIDVHYDAGDFPR